MTIDNGQRQDDLQTRNTRGRHGDMVEPSTPKAGKKRNVRGPLVWIAVASVDSATVTSLDPTPFRPHIGAHGEVVIRTPDRQGLPLVLVDLESYGLRRLHVPAPRKARRSEQAVEESVYSYLRLGIERLPGIEATDRPAELLRLLLNAYRHVSGYDIGPPRRQLGEMRGPAVRGGLPTLGKRHR
jgi:hypothetical protein